MPPIDKKVFVFTTTDTIRDRHHTLIRERLAEKGCTIINDKFSWLGQFAGTLRFNLNLNRVLALLGGKIKNTQTRRT
jgi:hypothetical protein